ncbi:MAG TPA: hypothetical protein VFE62_03510 [Gemmataceae bacterium]|nr:hypothetical protein [Gemmataceae bacterium]
MHSTDPAVEEPILAQVVLARVVPAEPIQAELVPYAIPVEKPKPLTFLGAIVLIINGIGSVWEWCFGFVSLLVFLAVLAAVPILQFLSLGYLLEASARIARTGRIRDGFIGVRIAARAGGFVIGTWLMLLPLRLVSSLWLSAQIIEADSTIAHGWDIGLNILTILMLIHIAFAWAAGGKLRHFLFPFANPILVAFKIARGGFWAKSRDAVWEFAASLRLPYYFWLGFRGFWGGLMWIVWPVTMLAFGRHVPILGFIGAVMLMVVLLYVPFLQLRFAVKNRFWAFFELGAVRRLFRRAPIALAFSFFITLLFAVPLYLLKIEMIPREAAWLPSLVFILFMFPARILTGWAFGRALRRKTPRNWFFRWTSRFFMLAVTFVYVVIVYFSQFAAWEGIWSLYEQHAFLLPVPFLAM